VTNAFQDLANDFLVGGVVFGNQNAQAGRTAVLGATIVVSQTHHILAFRLRSAGGVQGIK